VESTVFALGRGDGVAVGVGRAAVGVGGSTARHAAAAVRDRDSVNKIITLRVWITPMFAGPIYSETANVVSR
jgi:hypothetical protein